MIFDQDTTVQDFMSHCISVPGSLGVISPDHDPSLASRSARKSVNNRNQIFLFGAQVVEDDSATSSVGMYLDGQGNLDVAYFPYDNLPRNSSHRPNARVYNNVQAQCSRLMELPRDVLDHPSAPPSWTRAFQTGPPNVMTSAILEIGPMVNFLTGGTRHRVGTFFTAGSTDYGRVVPGVLQYSFPNENVDTDKNVLLSMILAFACFPEVSPGSDIQFFGSSLPDYQDNAVPALTQLFSALDMTVSETAVSERISFEF